MNKIKKKILSTLLVALPLVTIASAIACTSITNPADPEKDDQKDLETASKALAAKTDGWGLIGKNAFALTFKNLEKQLEKYKEAVKVGSQREVITLLENLFSKSFTKILDGISVNKITVTSLDNTSATLSLNLKKDEATLNDIKVKVINLKEPDSALETIKHELENQTFEFKYLTYDLAANKFIAVENPTLKFATTAAKDYEDILHKPATENGGDEAVLSTLLIQTSDKFKETLKNATLSNFSFSADNKTSTLTIKAKLNQTGQASLDVKIKITNFSKDLKTGNLLKLAEIINNKEFDASRALTRINTDSSVSGTYIPIEVSNVEGYKKYFATLKSNSLKLLTDLIKQPGIRKPGFEDYQDLTTILNQFGSDQKVVVNASLGESTDTTLIINITLKLTEDTPDSEMVKASFKIINFDDPKELKKFNDVVEVLKATDWPVDDTVEDYNVAQRRYLSLIKYNTKQDINLSNPTDLFGRDVIFSKLLGSKFKEALGNVSIVYPDFKFKDRDQTTWTIGFLARYKGLKTTKSFTINITNLTKDIDFEDVELLKKAGEDMNGTILHTELTHLDTGEKSTTDQANERLKKAYQNNKLSLLDLYALLKFETSTGLSSKQKINKVKNTLAIWGTLDGPTITEAQAIPEATKLTLKFKIGVTKKSDSTEISSDWITLILVGF
ncbi:hypothetical protein CJJ23_03745 [Mycoplasmopsis agassizii]|uniref:Lipoprotein associated domain-containing protein n=1 Tax=Mycoplasmopsis agassizii TaxID=33922 RepID=A0A269TK12_9BACT|nr:hypothetical protein [Mycoplasmopsis agassizii]PAK21085.1 hypothetical protein CJJ23_03745 [Mycoplasmopsis agassizii]